MLVIPIGFLAKDNQVKGIAKRLIKKVIKKNGI